MRSLTNLRPLRNLTTPHPLQRPVPLPLAGVSSRASAAAAAYHTTRPRRLPYKDDQDRESLRPKAPYGSQSAGDEAASHNPDSYSRQKTDPAEAEARDPDELEVSGANPGLSKPQGDEGAKESRPDVAGGPGATEDRKARSSGGKTTAGKAGKPN